MVGDFCVLYVNLRVTASAPSKSDCHGSCREVFLQAVTTDVTKEAVPEGAKGAERPELACVFNDVTV